ncbi:MAG: hypothetical protein LBU90_01300 [Bacteroidales bacterium]|jgi:hypothetical protein|nr:hypothetical protein [Bacteroidales bacterium]
MKKFTIYNLHVTLLFTILCFFVSISAFSQVNSRFNNHSYRPFDRYVYNAEHRFHTAIKPFDMQEVEKIVSIDTLFPLHTGSRVFDYIFNNDLIAFQTQAKDFGFAINPQFNFEIARNNGDSERNWINMRGIRIDAHVTNKVFFSTAFYEIQSFFTDYREDRIRELGYGIIPGIDRSKGLIGADNENKKGVRDYAFSEAYVSYIPSRYFQFQLGHGKQFIGDGYRSLLLSDNAPNYPYFRLTSNFWNIKYTSIWSYQTYFKENQGYNLRLPSKWNVAQYIDYSATKWLNVGLFTTVIWNSTDTLGNHRGFDFNYLNPVIFLRPVEFSIGSPDNVLMGLNGKITLWKKYVFYGQAMIDEFKISEFAKRSGWSNSKYALQGGFKSYDIAIKHLDFQTEVNYVRPFMYSHFIPGQEYSHGHQPLAHPRQSNFYESVSFVRYNFKRIFTEYKFQYMVFGQDTTGGGNYGNSIFRLYPTAAMQYGNTIAKFAVQNTVMYNDFSVSYLLNPKYNMHVALGLSHRTQFSALSDKHQLMWYFGFRTALHNFYYDF